MLSTVTVFFVFQALIYKLKETRIIQSFFLFRVREKLGLSIYHTENRLCLRTGCCGECCNLRRR